MPLDLHLLLFCSITIGLKTKNVNTGSISQDNWGGGIHGSQAHLLKRYPYPTTPDKFIFSSHSFITMVATYSLSPMACEALLSKSAKSGNFWAKHLISYLHRFVPSPCKHQWTQRLTSHRTCTLLSTLPML